MSVLLLTILSARNLGKRWWEQLSSALVGSAGADEVGRSQLLPAGAGCQPGFLGSPLWGLLLSRPSFCLGGLSKRVV